MVMATIETITAFHELRQNANWPSDSDDQKSALAKALDYQRAYYPVRATLTDAEQSIFDDAIALLALEMVAGVPVRTEQAVKRLKEQSSSGASVETEYLGAVADPFPQITALLAPLAPVPVSPAVRFARMSR